MHTYTVPQMSCLPKVVGTRYLTGKIASTFGGTLSSLGWIAPDATAENIDTDVLFSSYQISPDALVNLDPSLQQIAPLDMDQILVMTNTHGGSDGVLCLGERHNSAKDHMLQADSVRVIHQQRQNKV